MATPVRAVRRAAAHVPRPVIAATLAFGLLLTLWSTALPIGDAPDETAHADLVFHLATGAAYPRYDGRRIGKAAQRLCLQTTAAIRACPRKGEKVSPTNIRRHTAANAGNKDARPDFNEEGGDAPVGSYNQMLQHPPLYYWAMSGVIRAERFLSPGTGLPPLDREVALLRLANVLLVAPLPLLAWWACRRLGLADVIGIAASLVPFAVPQLLHIGSTLNNDNLLTLLVGVLTVLLAGVVRGDVSRRTAIAVGVVTGLALLTKAFALLLPVVVAAAYGLAWWRSEDRRRPSLGLVVAGVVTAAFGAWWYGRNLVRGDGLSPTTESNRLTTALRPRGFSADPARWLRRFVELFTDRFWGWFGWYTVRISIGVIIGATVVLLGLMVSAFVGIRRAPHRPLLAAAAASPGAAGRSGSRRLARPAGRVDLAVLLLPAALFGAFVMARSWSLYGRTSLFTFIQGRYVFGAMVGIALVVAVGMERLAGRWAAAVTLGWAVVMQVEGMRRVLSGYWGPQGSGPVDQVRALVAWSPWPGELFGVGAVALTAAAAWLVVEVLRTTRRPPLGPRATAASDPTGAMDDAAVPAPPPVAAPMRTAP